MGDGAESVVEGTERALSAADHLADMDAGAVAALRALARQIDAAASLDGISSLEDLKAKFDNTILPTYLKYCESLGLTPAGRVKLDLKKESRGKLAQLRSVRNPA